MTSQAMPITPVPLRNRYLAAFLAWLVPGSGHMYQGRTAKGILYAVCILSLYFLGFAMGDGKIVYWRWVNPMQNPDKFCLHYVGQFFVGLPALPALVQSTLSYYDLQPILGGFMAEPPQNVINGLQGYGKLIEVGTIYTTVAGLLNVLAIYDAFDGPAYADLDEAELLAVTVPSEAKLEGLKAEGSA
jgi:TM2 domain-containing membrane protein YozV